MDDSTALQCDTTAQTRIRCVDTHYAIHETHE